MNLLVFFKLGAHQGHLHFKIVVSDSVCYFALHTYVFALQDGVGLEKLLLTLEGLLFKNLHFGLHTLQVFLVEFCDR